MFSMESAWALIARMRVEQPLVHNITNQVVMPFVANSLLAAGASPVMAMAAEEMSDIVNIAQALALNIGTLTPNVVSSMHLALARANERNIPVVIDPVGAGASAYRTTTAMALLEASSGAILRGNAAEMLALAGEAVESKGVDSRVTSDTATAAAVQLARKYGCVVSVSGEVDYITDGAKLWLVRGGTPLMTRVTGMGCAATALTAALAGVFRREEGIPAAVSAMALMAAAGGLAFKVAQGPGSFAVAFLDALAGLEQKDFAAFAVIEEGRLES